MLLLILLLFVQAAPAINSKPAPIPDAWRGLIGEYGSEPRTTLVFERGGRLVARFNTSDESVLQGNSGDSFRAQGGTHNGQAVSFKRGRDGRATQIDWNGSAIPRDFFEPAPGVAQLQIKPLRPIADLRKEALAASPPKEPGRFLPTNLVELQALDPTIHLEIRYATANNFLGSRVYTQARAFMQRPAAEALVRVHRVLAAKGYGLLIHDAYRPWFVTKVFWDATPNDKKWLVADPAQGSRHNRGAAVDLTLFDLRTGSPVEMVSTYDESTRRAHADYPGGTSLQRWYRALLRAAMEAGGFIQNPDEWWHYDYKDWKNYPIGNQPFEQIP